MRSHALLAELFRNGACHSACVPCFRGVVDHLVSCESGAFTETSEIANSNETEALKIAFLTPSESSVTKQRCSILALIHPESFQIDPDC